MLTMELTTWSGQSCRLPTLLSWTLTYTGGVPCDSMTVCCPYDESMAEVLPNATRFTALQDGAVMLRGVIDAYEISLSSQGLLVTLEGLRAYEAAHTGPAYTPPGAAPVAPRNKKRRENPGRI